MSYMCVTSGIWLKLYEVVQDSCAGEEYLTRIWDPPLWMYTENKHRYHSSVSQTHYTESDYIIRQGATGDTFYVICEGQVGFICLEALESGEQNINSSS